jgi:ubiquitin fusion degradation protein 1
LQDFYPSDIGGFGAFMRRPPTGASMRRFDEYYRCYPIVMMSGPEREYANYGGKVFLPPSALEKLTRLHITYPMIFELINGNAGKTTHAGVLEFVAEEGRIYLPYWVCRSLPCLVQAYLLTRPPAHEDSLA